MTYREVEMNVVQWGEDRGIVQNATAMSQAIKTLEETTELLDALNKQNIDEAKDVYRDWETDRKSTRLNSSHSGEARMPSSA